MGEQSTHINYSIADIERYLQGGMGAKEMHDMEKAALQDPFLADAIEGYREISFADTYKRLNEINAAFRSEKKDAKLVALHAKKTISRWKAVAMIILVAGVGALSWYVLQNKNSRKDIALNTIKNDVQTDSVTPAPGQNETIPDKQNAAAPAADEQQKKGEKTTDKTAKNNPQVLVSAKKANNNNKEQTGSSGNEDKAAANNLTAPEKASANASKLMESNVSAPAITEGAANKNILSGRVITKNNQPVPNASIAIKGLKDSVKTDDNGNFSIIPADTNVNVVIVSTGYKTMDTVLSNGNTNMVTVSEAPSWLSQIPVTDMKTKTKAFTNNVNTNATETFPQGGWVSFQDYVYRKLHKERDTLNGPVVISGNVELEFSVNDDGIPYDFKVLKSLDTESDAEAIAIIKEGPHWIAARKNKKAKVTIQF